MKEGRDAPEEILERAEKHKENLKRLRTHIAPHIAAGEGPRLQGGATAPLSQCNQVLRAVGPSQRLSLGSACSWPKLFEVHCSLEAAYSVTPHSRWVTVFSSFVVEREHEGLSTFQPSLLCSFHSGKDHPPSA